MVFSCCSIDFHAFVKTVNGHRYHPMILEFFRPKWMDIDLEEISFQQDGTIPHFKNDVIDVLIQRIISRKLLDHQDHVIWHCWTIFLMIMWKVRYERIIHNWFQNWTMKLFLSLVRKSLKYFEMSSARYYFAYINDISIKDKKFLYTFFFNLYTIVIISMISSWKTCILKHFYG